MGLQSHRLVCLLDYDVGRKKACKLGACVMRDSEQHTLVLGGSSRHFEDLIKRNHARTEIFTIFTTRRAATEWSGTRYEFAVYARYTILSSD